jgi:3-oxoacyl-[acyl-carrier-protein] synthase I
LTRPDEWQDIDITAFGLLTSVGHDAVQACAAVRAGITRPAGVDGFVSYDAAEARVLPGTGHPLTPITNGFTGTARWLQMAPRALQDLIRNGDLPGAEHSAFWAATGMVVMIPDLEHERFEFDERCQSASIHRTFLAPLASWTRDRMPVKSSVLSPTGRVGLPDLLERWRDVVDEMQVERIIVVSVDSYLCPFALDWLGDTNQLKTDLNPAGLVPGEAAAALLLEPARARSHRTQTPCATIVRAASAKDKDAEDPDGPPRGGALAGVLAAVMDSTTLDVYVDLNGQPWRANEYGLARVQLAAQGVRHAFTVHHPASELGDTGAASVVVNTVLAARSLQRGYAAGGQVAVAASMDGGRVGGLALRRPER